MSAVIEAPRRDDEIELTTLFGMLWQNKVLIISTALLFGVIAAVWALLATEIYLGEVVVTEVDEQKLGGGGGLTDQLGGLASLAGVNLSLGNAGQKSKAVLNSRNLVEEFIKRNNLMPELFPEAEEPASLWMGVRKFRSKVLTIKEETRKGTITVGIKWRDAETAARWANQFVALANDLLRDRAIEESERNVAYLNKQILATNMVEMQKVMYRLVESETKNLMLANGRIEYAFSVVDPAVKPEVRVSPMRTVMVLVGLVVGGLIGSIWVFSRQMAVRRKQLAAMAG